MAKGVVSTSISFIKNVFRSVGWMLTGKAAPKQVLKNIGKDTRKLGQALGHTGGGARDQAFAITRDGRQLYNDRKYVDAEYEFRRAIAIDKHYGLAYAYLGYSLYKQDRIREALHYWDLAVEMEPGSEGAKKAELKLTHYNREHRRMEKWVEETIDGNRGKNTGGRDDND